METPAEVLCHAVPYHAMLAAGDGVLGSRALLSLHGVHDTTSWPDATRQVSWEDISMETTASVCPAWLAIAEGWQVG